MTGGELVVRPEGTWGTPAYWFNAKNRRTFISLALGTGLFNIVRCGCQASPRLLHVYRRFGG